MKKSPVCSAGAFEVLETSIKQKSFSVKKKNKTKKQPLRSCGKANSHCNHHLWDHTSVGKRIQLSGAPWEHRCYRISQVQNKIFSFLPRSGVYHAKLLQSVCYGEQYLDIHAHTGAECGLGHCSAGVGM